MTKKLKQKILEAFSSVLPVTVIVLALSFTLAPMPTGTLLLFLLGAILLVVGMGFFTLGADSAMLEIGEAIGGRLVKNRKLGLIATASLLIGVAITVAEPDLQVLADQVPAVADMTIIITVAVGVGIFLAASSVRSFFKLPLRAMLIVLYIAVFILSVFVPSEFLAVAFDSGGVTTGPITVPFIMGLGIGMAAIRSGNQSEEDSFGLIALCSVGPILAVMIMGLFYRNMEIAYEPAAVVAVETSQDVARQLAIELPVYLREVALGLTPILAIFALFQAAWLRIARRPLAKIGVGVGYTLIGLVLFLTGVNLGFLPAGSYIGKHLAMAEHSWILIPLSMLVGYFLVAAEPAVHVLNKQVEEITDGAIPQKAMSLSLSVGVALSAGLAMVRVLTGIHIYWFVVPGYIAALAMSFFVPKIFTAIAFDSGGVASGPMTATFLLPFAMGACEGVGGNVLTDAFGVVAMVAMTPLITIQILGLLYERKLKRTEALLPIGEGPLSDDIIEYPDK